MIRQTLYKMRDALPDGYYMRIGRVQKRPGPRNSEYSESAIFRHPGIRILDVTSKVDDGVERHTGHFTLGHLREALRVAEKLGPIQNIYGPHPRTGERTRVPVDPKKWSQYRLDFIADIEYNKPGSENSLDKTEGRT